jgi:tetratricopeptide (TPR) repeat protein
MKQQLLILMLFLANSQAIYAQTASDQRKADRLFSKTLIQHEVDKDYEGAITNYDQVIVLNPSHVLAYYYRGEAKGALGRYADAIADYDQAIANDTHFCQAYMNRGITKALLGRFTDAIADFDHVIYLAPYAKQIYTYRGGYVTFGDDMNVGYNNRGKAKYDLASYVDAIADFDKFIALNASYAYAYYYRGESKVHLGHYAEAIIDFDKTIELKPKYEFVYNDRGEAKDYLSLYGDAIADFDQAIALYPKDAKAYNNRGFAYYKMGGTKANYRKAVADYDISIQLGGSNYKPEHQYRDDAMAALDKAVNQ